MSGDLVPGTGTVACQLFDCMQVNLAVLADRWHGVGTHLNIGSVLRFRPAAGPDDLPTVEGSFDRQLADAERSLGLVVQERRTARSADDLVPAEGRYVVADAYYLPWVPYFGQCHMDHSFLMEPAADGTAVVVDGYHNETPWGSARPVRRLLDRAALAAAMPGPALVVTLAPAAYAPAASGPELDLASPEETDAYVTKYAEHADRLTALHRLTLETWLLARSRKLHTRFLEARGLVPEGSAAAAHVAAWESLAESVCLGCRRVERGRPEPRELITRLAQQLHGDREVFGSVRPRAAERPVPSSDAPMPDSLRRRVAAAAGAVLKADPGALLGGRPLADVPGFSSFRTVEIVERLERELSVEFAADDLVPENLHHVDGICRIVLRALPTGTTPKFARNGGV